MIRLQLANRGIKNTAKVYNYILSFFADLSLLNFASFDIKHTDFAISIAKEALNKSRHASCLHISAGLHENEKSVCAICTPDLISTSLELKQEY